MTPRESFHSSLGGSILLSLDDDPTWGSTCNQFLDHSQKVGRKEQQFDSLVRLHTDIAMTLRILETTDGAGKEIHSCLTFAGLCSGVSQRS